MENYVDELKKLLESVGFEGNNVKIPYEYIYKHIKTIKLQEMNHQSDLVTTIGILQNDDTPTKENTQIDIRISLYDNDQTYKMSIKNCIEFIKSQFKFELRKVRVEKLLNDNKNKHEKDENEPN